MEIVQIRDEGIYTPIVEYRKNHHRVLCMGLLHIGEREYFDALQVKINNIPFGFYEHNPISANPELLSKRRRRLLSVVRHHNLNGWRILADYTGLVFEEAALDVPNYWESIDMTCEELYSDKTTNSLRKVVRGWIERNIAKELAYQKDPFLAAKDLFDGGKPDDVKTQDRNVTRDNRLIDAIENALQEGYPTIGIAYGSGHLHAVDQFLYDQGFEQTTLEWLCAVKYQ